MIIELENIKGIRRLDFEVPGEGLWLLTGLNGCGKSTLLAALYRINNGRAFQDYFRTSATQSRVDTFKNSRVRYKINGEEVTYSYRGKRWPPTPRRNAAILNDFPYPAIRFIEANSDRIEPYADEIVPRRIRNASDNIKEFMCSVLDDCKWQNLKYVNTRRGTGNQAFILPYRVERETHYYSEKNFSLGELCILRLAIKLNSIQNQSMILIDEIEMALHPQAQVRLLVALRRISSQRALTVIFSTHSATLIKNVGRKNICFLSSDGGGYFKVIYNVYPAHVLGEMAFDEEVDADFIFYVEDDQAKYLLEQIFGKYESCVNSHKPLYKIVPVGGFTQVLRMLSSSVKLFPQHIRRFAFLDDDVRTESLPEARRRNVNHVTQLYDRQSEKVKFLPCTPELGLVDYLETCRDQGRIRELEMDFSGVRVRLGNYLTSQEYTEVECGAPRKTAKAKLESIIARICYEADADRPRVIRSLYRKYVDHHYQSYGHLMQYCAPIFNLR